LPIGANGMAFQRAAGTGGGKGASGPSAYVYILNTSYGQIVRVPIEADGAAGQAEVWLETPALVGADGMTQDAAGNLYVAVNLQDRIVRIGPDRRIVTVAEGAPLDAPASPEISGGTLYVTNFAVGRALGLAPGAPAPSVVRIDLGP
jgi:sugar lactone lactonase YvrE